VKNAENVVSHQNMNKKEFSPRNARQLYAELVDKVMLAIRMKIDHGEDALDTALDQLYSHIERSFVCTLRTAFSLNNIG
jgi:hypothetical protein